VTNPHQFTSTQPPDRLAIKLRQWQPMIVKVWDVPEYVKTPTNKDGMVRMPGMDPFPNRAVRAAVVDLTAGNGQGILYPETWFQAHSLWKPMVKWVGQLKLISWAQEQDPKDAYGNPVQTNPYRVLDMSGDPDAVAAAQAWLAAHPEWDELVPPAPYDGKPPPPPQPQYQPPQQPWNQQPPQQWQPPAPPQQPPSPWNTAAPPPGYYQQPPQQPDQWGQQGQWAQQSHNAQPTQLPPGAPQGQWGPPQQASAPPAPPYQGQGYQQVPQAPQGAPGSFFQAAGGQQGPPQPPQQYLPNQQGPQAYDGPPPF
jgi:hypothetical protein